MENSNKSPESIVKLIAAKLHHFPFPFPTVVNTAVVTPRENTKAK